MATIVINFLIWNKHAKPLGLMALSVCLAGGTFYQQAPMREDNAPRRMASEAASTLSGSAKELDDATAITTKTAATCSGSLEDSVPKRAAASLVGNAPGEEGGPAAPAVSGR